MRNKPRIRFKGFTEDWEQRKLGQFTARVTRKNGGQSDLPLTISAQDGLVDQRKYFNRQVASRDMSNYYLIKKGEFAYNKSYSEGYPFGAVKRLDYYNIGALSTLYILFEITDKNISSDFIVSYYMTHLWYKEISKRAAEGARNHGLLNISTEDFFDSELNIPNSIEEQVKIGNFIKEFDKFITLHQRKLEKLKLAKKALLQKLFPKNGSQFPEIRFKGFTDAWEQRKLGDFYTFKNGLNKEKVYFGYGDSIVNFTDVFHNRQIYSSTLKGKVFVNKKELENFRVKEGDLFFTRTSETIDEIGFPAVVMEPMERVVFSGFVLRGRAEKNDPLVNIFKSYIFFTDNFRSEMKKKSSMTTRALTSGTALKEMYFSYPKDLEEQTKIGEILLRLDNIITIHQCKLDKLQDVKKGLLQKMFV